jgi:hypothetical protein
MSDKVQGPKQPEETPEPTSKNRTPKRKLRYAPGHTDLFRTGATDDPMSASFIPLEQRSAIERARLFARKKKVNPKVVEFD